MMERLPCGCLMGESTDGKGEPVFIMEPCALDCRNYLYAVAESKRQGNPVTIIDAR